MNALSALSERLSTVASLIPSCEIVVDVGSDHGKLSAWCLQSGRCKRIVATDIHKLPAERTREKLFVEGLSEQSEVRVADGLSGVELQSDMTVVIAGMGGLEICKILREAMDSCENTAGGKKGFPVGVTLVLQPQRSLYEVREFLSEMGFLIKEEKIAREEKHFYPVMQVEYTEKPYALSDDEKFFGPFILEKRVENYGAYMEHEHNVMKKRALGDKRCEEILKKWEKYV